MKYEVGDIVTLFGSPFENKKGSRSEHDGCGILLKVGFFYGHIYWFHTQKIDICPLFLFIHVIQ